MKRYPLNSGVKVVKGNYKWEKYFLTDSELENVNGDFFNTNDLKKNIFKILENNKTPYNIAVIGKWGLGKSSLINMVKIRA